MAGRAAFEKVIALDTGICNQEALLIDNDTAPAPLHLHRDEEFDRDQ